MLVSLNEDKPEIILEQEVYNKLSYLAKKLETEFMVFLVGEGLHIKDFIIPYQEVSPSHCKLKVEKLNSLIREVVQDIIGWAHSHNRMGTFHSPIDLNTTKMFNRDYFISLVIDSEGQLEAKIFLKKPFSCSIDADIMIVFSQEDMEKLLEIAKERIQEITWGWKKKDFIKSKYYDPVSKSYYYM